MFNEGMFYSMFLFFLFYRGRHEVDGWVMATYTPGMDWRNLGFLIHSEACNIEPQDFEFHWKQKRPAQPPMAYPDELTLSSLLASVPRQPIW